MSFLARTNRLFFEPSAVCVYRLQHNLVLVGFKLMLELMHVYIVPHKVAQFRGLNIKEALLHWMCEQPGDPLIFKTWSVKFHLRRKEAAGAFKTWGGGRGEKGLWTPRQLNQAEGSGLHCRSDTFPSSFMLCLSTNHWNKWLFIISCLPNGLRLSWCWTDTLGCNAVIRGIKFASSFSSHQADVSSLWPRKIFLWAHVYIYVCMRLS